MLVKSNFSRLCKTVCVCVCVCVCVSSPCSHDVKIIYSIYLKRKNGDHHSTQTSTARTRLFFSMFQIYILFVSPRKRSTFKKRFENKRGRTLQLLRLFGFIRHSFTCSRPRLIALTTQKQTAQPHRQHLSCSCFTCYSFSTFS